MEIIKSFPYSKIERGSDLSGVGFALGVLLVLSSGLSFGKTGATETACESEQIAGALLANGKDQISVSCKEHIDAHGIVSYLRSYSYSDSKGTHSVSFNGKFVKVEVCVRKGMDIEGVFSKMNCSTSLEKIDAGSQIVYFGSTEMPRATGSKTSGPDEIGLNGMPSTKGYDSQKGLALGVGGQGTGGSDQNMRRLQQIVPGLALGAMDAVSAMKRNSMASQELQNILSEAEASLRRNAREELERSRSNARNLEILFGGFSIEVGNQTSPVVVPLDPEYLKIESSLVDPMSFKRFDLSGLVRQNLEKSFENSLATKNPRRALVAAEYLLNQETDEARSRAEQNLAAGFRDKIIIAEAFGESGSWIDKITFISRAQDPLGHALRAAANQAQIVWIKNQGLKGMDGSRKRAFILGVKALQWADQKYATNNIIRGDLLLSASRSLFSVVEYGSPNGDSGIRKVVASFEELASYETALSHPCNESIKQTAAILKEFGRESERLNCPKASASDSVIDLHRSGSKSSEKVGASEEASKISELATVLSFLKQSGVQPKETKLDKGLSAFSAVMDTLAWAKDLTQMGEIFDAVEKYRVNLPFGEKSPTSIYVSPTGEIHVTPLRERGQHKLLGAGGKYFEVELVNYKSPELGFGSPHKPTPKEVKEWFDRLSPEERELIIKTLQEKGRFPTGASLF